MDQGMKLSVIVPSLTGQVPESLRRQTEGRDDVEVIVVTGVSPVGRARNVGLGRAHGEYIAWMDSDDDVTESWLDDIASSIADGVDGLLFDAEARGWSVETSFVYGGDQKMFGGDELEREIYRDGRLKSHLWRWVLRRELWDGEGFDEQVSALEDYLVLPKVVGRAKSVKYLPKILYHYLYHENSAVNALDEARDVASVQVALRRYQESALDCKRPALWGAATIIYWSLDKVAVGGLVIGPSYRSALSDGRRFIARHLWGLWRESGETGEPFGLRLRWMARFVTAAFGWWWIQRWSARKDKRDFLT